MLFITEAVAITWCLGRKASTVVMPREQTFYEILGISEKAAQNEVEKAYKKKALRCHPDRHLDTSDTDVFVDLAEAYDVLSDERGRMRYDLWLSIDRKFRTSPGDRLARGLPRDARTRRLIVSPNFLGYGPPIWMKPFVMRPLDAFQIFEIAWGQTLEEIEEEIDSRAFEQSNRLSSAPSPHPQSANSTSPHPSRRSTDGLGPLLSPGSWSASRGLPSSYTTAADTTTTQRTRPRAQSNAERGDERNNSDHLRVRSGSEVRSRSQEPRANGVTSAKPATGSDGQAGGESRFRLADGRLVMVCSRCRHENFFRMIDGDVLSPKGVSALDLNIPEGGASIPLLPSSSLCEEPSIARPNSAPAAPTHDGGDEEPKGATDSRDDMLGKGFISAHFHSSSDLVEAIRLSIREIFIESAIMELLTPWERSTVLADSATRPQSAATEIVGAVAHPMRIRLQAEVLDFVRGRKWLHDFLRKPPKRTSP